MASLPVVPTAMCIDMAKGREGVVRDRVMVQVRNVLQVSELGAFPPPPAVSRVSGKVL